MKQKLNALAPLMLSLTRIMAGLIFMAHGTQKLLNFPAAESAPAMFSLSWIAGLIELVCGALIAVGFLTRAAAFLSSGLMAFAYFLAHAPRDFFPVNNGGDAAILYCFFFLFLVCYGPGPLSLDRILGRDR
ncbi:DoxX family protein [Sedimentitalea sp. JM2-8]|uniref:DoxX family protein n=1 Tax=Sedimentitalea xiamensis TaxID=3050037 RepID=A0ABT7FBM2_9RHOB|nr:DoxX family protein [Sedimentitalea xiamensis]MDK3072508.1 DoxX family protein [Sedimentitalea xiamensis]